jgi:hypothetical protein
MNTLGAPKLYILFIISIGIKDFEYFIVVLWNIKPQNYGKRLGLKIYFYILFFLSSLWGILGKSRDKSSFSPYSVNASASDLNKHLQSLL